MTDLVTDFIIGGTIICLGNQSLKLKSVTDCIRGGTIVFWKSVTKSVNNSNFSDRFYFTRNNSIFGNPSLKFKLVIDYIRGETIVCLGNRSLISILATDLVTDYILIRNNCV